MAPARQRGVSGVTLQDFFAAVLRGLGAPVTQNNLTKLGAVAKLEGHGGDYNPFNYIVGPGTNFNSVGVKNYPDLATGVAQTVRLLKQGNTTAMRNNLLSDGQYGGWLDATSRFYQSWGGPAVRTSEAAARGYLSNQIDGPPVPAEARAALGSGGVMAPGGTASDPHNWAGIAKAIDESKAAFNTYLGTQTKERQQQIIDELRTDRDLSGVAQYMSTAPKEVNDYIKFLASLPGDKQIETKAALTTVEGPGAPSASSSELTSLLQTFGVSYPNAPQPTPALLAFLRGIGLNLSTAEDVKRRAIERIGAATTDAMADIDRAAGRNKQNLTADLVRRGVLQSGESNTRYARQAEDVAAQQADVQRTAATAKETSEDAYRAAADLARQQALDRVINAETEQAQQTAASKAQADAYKQQQAASDIAWQRQQEAQNQAIARQEELMKQYAAQGVQV